MNDGHVAEVSANDSPVDDSAATKRQPRDLEERTVQFGEAVIRFAKRVRRGPVTSPLIGQLVRSGTSVGASYCHAEHSKSKKIFVRKIRICRTETRETQYWLRMIAKAVPQLERDARALWREANDLHLIYSTIFRHKKKPR